MESVYRYLLPAMWLAWVAYWWARARDVKVNARRESRASRVLHVAPLVAAIGLLWIPFAAVPVLNTRFLPPSVWSFWVGVVLTAKGLLFCVWARRHLGRNWSGTVTVKEGHELITSGPYALVRHPIYTGLLVAFAGSALAGGEWRGVLALALVVLAFWQKIRTENRWMVVQFGDAYLSYCRRVAALVPYLL